MNKLKCNKCGEEINFGSEQGVAWTESGNPETVRHFRCDIEEPKPRGIFDDKGMDWLRPTKGTSKDI